MVEEYWNKLEEARSAMAEQFQDKLEEGLSTMAEECITPMQDQITEIIRGIESLRVDLTSVRLMVNGALRRVEILERDLASLKKDGKGVVVGVDAGVGIGGGGMSENWPFLDNDPLKKLKPKRPDDNNDRNIGEAVLGGICAEPPRQNALTTSHLPSGSSHLQPQAQQQDKCSHTRGSNAFLPGVPIPSRKPDDFTSNDNPFDTRAHRPHNEPQNQQEKRNNNTTTTTTEACKFKRIITNYPL